MTGKMFFIKKRGFFYRPDAQGYTADAMLAGRYTEAEAISHRDSCDPGELTLVEVPPEFSDVPDDIMRFARECSDKLPVDWAPDTEADTVRNIALAILYERERCAKVAEDAANEPCSGPEWGSACRDIAETIRKGET